LKDRSSLFAFAFSKKGKKRSGAPSASPGVPFHAFTPSLFSLSASASLFFAATRQGERRRPWLGLCRGASPATSIRQVPRYARPIPRPSIPSLLLATCEIIVRAIRIVLIVHLIVFGFRRELWGVYVSCAAMSSNAGASVAPIGGGAARARSRSFGSSSSNGRAADGNGAGVFVRAGADNEMYVRADKIDLKNLDVQLEKSRSQVWLEHQRSQRTASPRPETPLLEWEIDLAKLDIQNQIAHGTFGVVYRGTYDGHDVAGTYVHTSARNATCEL
jgi:hypothetical protein